MVAVCMWACVYRRWAEVPPRLVPRLVCVPRAAVFVRLPVSLLPTLPAVATVPLIMPPNLSLKSTFPCHPLMLTADERQFVPFPTFAYRAFL